jgi:hypothetical protein
VAQLHHQHLQAALPGVAIRHQGALGIMMMFIAAAAAMCVKRQGPRMVVA